MSTWPVSALCTGRSALIADGKRSAIAKHPLAGPVRIGTLGLDGDTQVNRKYHGGPEMAVHCYPLAHHDHWREMLGDHPLLSEPGAFGGNLAVNGITEADVRIGERFRLGSAILEISQPRMPCGTIERRFERGGMVAEILRTGRCGWYFRIVKEGDARAGDDLEAIEGTGGDYTVRDTFTALAEPKGPADRALLEALADCRELTAEWRSKASAKLTGIRA